MWNRVADQLADANDTTLTQNARLLALMNIALADATIGIWNAKNTFNSWRPVTAIRRPPRPDLDAAPAHPGLPGISLRALGRQQRRRLGARLLLRRRHLVHASPRPGCPASSATSPPSRPPYSRSRTHGSTPASTSASPSSTAPRSARRWPSTSSTHSCSLSTETRSANCTADRQEGDQWRAAVAARMLARLPHCSRGVFLTEPYRGVPLANAFAVIQKRENREGPSPGPFD